MIPDTTKVRSATDEAEQDTFRSIRWAAEGTLPRQRIDLLSLVPLVAILSLVGLVWALVWAVNRSDSEQAQIKLATDALWVEQTLRFQLNIDEDMLVSLAMDTAGGIDAATLAARARTHIVGNPEVQAIVWHGPDGARIRALPGTGAPSDDALVEQLLRIDAQPSRPVYGSVNPDGTVSIGMKLPDGEGVMTATLSLQQVLHRHLPWWIAEQYGVRVIDADDSVLAKRQRMTPDPLNPSHTISFDPPLHGIWLQINAYKRPAAFHATVLFASIAGLATFAILALLILFRALKRSRKVELQLQDETAFRRAMEESLTVGLRAKDLNGRVLFVNPAFCKLIGWPAGDLVGHTPPMPYWHPDNLPETEERHRKLAAGGAVSQSFETRFRHRDGHDIDIQVYEAPLIDARGVHRGWMGSVIDITEAKRAARMARAQDEALARTGRLVTLGEMASTLAHELNQPLSSITSYATGMMNLMEQDRADPQVMKEATGKLAHQAARAGLIIHHIQALVRKREPKFTPTLLDDVVHETIGFLAADAREHRVHLKCTGTIPTPVEADRVLLEQLLINLIRNGMEAMGAQRHGNEVCVRLKEQGEDAIIEIQDQGGGISPDLDGRLFNAFATTKPQGMGMGLKICRSIVELHRGQLSHFPAPGGGTVFRITLPRTGILPTASGEQT